MPGDYDDEDAMWYDPKSDSYKSWSEIKAAMPKGHDDCPTCRAMYKPN